ncbi:50S ribosomal protein L36 [Candidatus Berkelbacteria bacterium]|nr:50S ribosomal protein L36 [Candidatus Berkelbacteria bacterium]
MAKVKSSIGKQCENCQIITRKRALRVICSRNKRHNRRQG